MTDAALILGTAALAAFLVLAGAAEAEIKAWRERRTQRATIRRRIGL